MSSWSAIFRRAAQLWQGPLLIVSLGLLAAAVVHYREHRPKPSLVDKVAALEALVDSAQHERAMRFAQNLLAVDAPDEALLPRIYLSLARAEYAVSQARGVGSSDTGRRIVDHYQPARAVGLPLRAEDHQAIGRALEWQGHHDRALESYGRALEEGISGAEELRRHIIEVQRDHLAAAPEAMRAQLAEFLEDVSEVRLDLTLWALREIVEVNARLDALDDAVAALEQQQAVFEASDLRDEFDCLQGLALYRQGRLVEAETLLRSIRNRADVYNPAHAQSGWLLGRVIYATNAPERLPEAASFFSDVISYHPKSDYATASYVGLGDTFADQGRHDEALMAYSVVLDDASRRPPNTLLDEQALRTSLAVRADTQRQLNNPALALRYIRLADQLRDSQGDGPSLADRELSAQIKLFAAEELDARSKPGADADAGTSVAASPAARDAYGDAAAAFLDLSRMPEAGADRIAASTWKAAELFTRSGQIQRAITIYGEFAGTHPADTLVSRALLRIGRLSHRIGRFTAAVEALQTCYRRYPRTLDGARALVFLAETYEAMGSEQVGLAEKALRVVLDESDVVTPESPVFADALFLLGEVLYRRGANEEAITVFTESAERYPDDPRRERAIFLTANAYRKSALALKRELAGQSVTLDLELGRETYLQRFRTAAEQYRRLIEQYEVRGIDQLDPLEQTFLRHAHLYEADCYFELPDHRAALMLYEQAAGAYAGHRSALAAFVQIVNCHVFLGETVEARAAMARALTLVESMPASAFEQSLIAENSDSWKQYFEWLGASKLF